MLPSPHPPTGHITWSPVQKMHEYELLNYLTIATICTNWLPLAISFQSFNSYSHSSFVFFSGCLTTNPTGVFSITGELLLHELWHLTSTHWVGAPLSLSPDWCRRSTGTHTPPGPRSAGSPRTSPLGWGRSRPATPGRPAPWRGSWRSCAPACGESARACGCGYNPTQFNSLQITLIALVSIRLNSIVILWSTQWLLVLG